MAATAAPWPRELTLDSLGAIGERIGHGAESIVYELPELRLPDVINSLVYKEYRNAARSPGNSRLLVDLRLKLDTTNRRRLDTIAAWPCRVVTEQGRVVGVVCPRVDHSFYEPVTSHGTKTSKIQLSEVQHLFISLDKLRLFGRTIPTEEQRLSLCMEFAATLAFLHDVIGVVVGDINPRNEVYRLYPSPAIQFIDCDGAREQDGDDPEGQLNTPDWVPPETGPLNVATDLYKLGLFILRCLSPGDHASELTDPAGAGIWLDDTGRAMLAAAVTGPPDARPRAREWQVYLGRLLGHPVDPPKVLAARLDRDLVLAGQPCELHWAAEDAIVIEVRHGPTTIRIDGRAGSGSLAVELAETGFVHVKAINDVASDHVIIGPVPVVTPPAQTMVPVGLPDISWPSTELPTLPDAASLGLPALPSISLPGLFTTQPPGTAMTWPSLPSVPCPIDVVSLMTGGPAFELDNRHKGPR